MAAQNLIAEQYEIDFYMIFHFKAVQTVVAVHYERDFDKIFHIMVAQNLVAEHYERHFDMIFQRQFKTWLQITMKNRDFDAFFYLWRLKSWLLSIMRLILTAQNLVAEHHERVFDMILHFMVAQKLDCRAPWKRIG